VDVVNLRQRRKALEIHKAARDFSRVALGGEQPPVPIQNLAAPSELDGPAAFQVAPPGLALWHARNDKSYLCFSVFIREIRVQKIGCGGRLRYDLLRLKAAVRSLADYLVRRHPSSITPMWTVWTETDIILIASAVERTRITGTMQNRMRAAMQPWQLAARAFHRVLKIARTIADLAGSGVGAVCVVPHASDPNADIAPAHLAEAIQYRPRRQE
jgi:hypothetical protein